MLGVRPLAYVGRHSLSLYIWHFPIYMYLYHHTDSWSYQLRTAVALALTVLVAQANDRTVEHWVGRALIDPRWSRLDRGVPAYLRALVGAAAQHTSAAGREVRSPAPNVDGATVREVSGDAAGRAATATSEQPRPTRPDDA